MHDDKQAAAGRPSAISWPDLVFLAAAMLVCGLATWWISSHYPWRRGFDDFDHIPAALRWAKELRLSDDSLFLRVPFWPMLLGTFFRIFGVTAGLLLVQAGVVFGTLVIYFRYTASLRSRVHPAMIYLPPAVFLLSPQVLLYSRHAVNEPFIGLLAATVLLVGREVSSRRGFGLGILCGVATMSKIASAALIVPAVVMLLHSRLGTVRARALVGLVLGMTLVLAPLVTLHIAQRGWVVIDTTSAYNLSRYDAREWWELGDHMERYRAGMADFRDAFSGDPVGYLRGFIERLNRWILRPSSADFALFYKDYPHGLLRAWDTVVLWTLGLAALLGTDRRNASIWVFILAMVVGCTFPRHTPYSPKVTLIYPFLLLAPYGLACVAGRRTPRAEGA